MNTHSGEILKIAERAHKDAIVYAGRDHSPDDYKSLLMRLGSAVEVFLSDHVHVGLHKKWTFAQLIDGLEPIGIIAQHREFLHNLRDAYNKAKHDPAYQAPIQPVITILSNSKTALHGITKLGVGDVDQRSDKVLRRLLWFAAWDHYIGGDTEVSIFLPCSVDLNIPPGFEIIYLKMEAWETVSAELSAVGSLCLGRDCLPAKFYDFWSEQGEFLEAGSFEGDLRDMITVFARHERVEDVLPDLKRENEPYSMLAAALFATTDLARQGGLPDDPAALTEAIISAAGSHYSAPSTSRLLKRFAAAIAGLIGKCPKETRDRLAGPLWVGAVRYAELESERLHQLDEPQLMVLRDGCLVVRI